LRSGGYHGVSEPTLSPVTYHGTIYISSLRIIFFTKMQTLELLMRSWTRIHLGFTMITLDFLERPTVTLSSWDISLPLIIGRLSADGKGDPANQSPFSEDLLRNVDLSVLDKVRLTIDADQWGRLDPRQRADIMSHARGVARGSAHAASTVELVDESGTTLATQTLTVDSGARQHASITASTRAKDGYPKVVLALGLVCAVLLSLLAGLVTSRSAPTGEARTEKTINLIRIPNGSSRSSTKQSAAQRSVFTLMATELISDYVFPSPTSICKDMASISRDHDPDAAAAAVGARNVSKGTRFAVLGNFKAECEPDVSIRLTHVRDRSGLEEWVPSAGLQESGR
jgi:hypothetical protein